MSDRLILLPGWGLGTDALEPLVAALQQLAEPVPAQIEPLPTSDAAGLAGWLDALDARLPDGVWLGGWSLGGMLAAELAARRGERCPGLLTLASNACFVARADWPDAMPAETFKAFLAACEADPKTLLKRFASLCAQGGADPRGLSRRLAVAEPASIQTLVEGLHVLAALDTRAALQAFGGRQLHLFAAGDSLVPVGTVNALRELVPEAEIGVVERASHGFMLEDPDRVAGAIGAFVHE